MSADEILLYLLIDLVIIIAATRVLGLASRRIGQPAVVGEIIAGVVLGPTVLGRIHTSWPAQLFPTQVPLKSVADLGLIFFMFLVGLELDPLLLRKEGRRALQISLSGIVLPLAGGLIVGLLLMDVNSGGKFVDGVTNPPKQLTIALFLGAAMCITAFPVLARILVETGLYKTAVGTATLCAAAVDDVCAWILLAAVVGITRTGSAAEAGRAFLLTLVFVGVMATAGRWLLQLLAKHYERTQRLSVELVAAVLAGVLLSAYVTQIIGVHYIFGAFVFGLVMPKRTGMTSELTDKVEDFTVIVLLPVFFAVTGLRTNLLTLNSPALVGWLALILFVAIAGKFVGCGLAARLTGATNRESVVIGSLMNTRGLTELVILSIGLSLGVLSDRTFAMMVIMALVTTVLAAPIVNRLMPREMVLREIAELAGAATRGPVTRILVILGNPDNAPALVNAGICLLGARRPAELLLVRLIPTARAPQFRTGLKDEESGIEASVASMRGLVDQAAAANVDARPLSFLTDDLTADVMRLAADQQCETIVSGWHRASVEQSVIRTSVHRLFRLAGCAVVVLVDREGRGIQRAAGGTVALALRAGESDDGAARIAAVVAESLGGAVKTVEYDAVPNAARAVRPGSAASGTAAAAVLERTGDLDGVRAAAAAGLDAAVLVVAANPRVADDNDFGQPADALAGLTACPMLAVRSAERRPA